MATVFCGVSDGKLIKPASWHDAELLASIPPNREAKINVTFPRSLPEHRFYWALLQRVCEATGVYPKAEQLHMWIKTRLGYVDELVFHDGTLIMRVSSSSFEAMDGLEFRRLVHGAIDLIATEILRSATGRSHLIADVEQMIGIKAPLDPRALAETAVAA